MPDFLRLALTQGITKRSEDFVMTDSAWVPVSGILMTSERIEAYGGIRIPTEILKDLAQQVNAGKIPWHLDHNLSKPLRIRRFGAFVESRGDGIDVLKFRAEIHKGDLHWMETRPGMSATIRTPLSGSAPDHVGAAVSVSADHAWFADDALVEVAEQLVAQGVDHELIRVERTYQFGFVPDPQIFIDVVYPVLLGIGSSAIWDGIKKLWSRRRVPKGADSATSNVVNVSITDGDRSLRAVVTTNDEAVAQRAMESLDSAVDAFFNSSPKSLPEARSQAVTEWDDESRNWTPPA